MSDRPIIFSGPMVQALLAGRKTQTRRLIQSPLNSCQPRDRLWVRENFKLVGSGMDARGEHLIYDADGSEGWARSPLRAVKISNRTRPSIHMPRWASRLTLAISSVEVQSLQEISEDDAQAEGVAAREFRTAVMQTVWPSSYHIPLSYRAAFANLWSRLHGPGSWEANPEVIALTFTVSHTNIDALQTVAA